MILKTKVFKEQATTILNAIDNSEVSTLKETLELKTVGSVLYLNVTNREYYASAKFTLEHEEPFHATVNANQFLKLIAAVTTEEIELTAHSTYLSVKANGSYKIPYIFDDDKLLELPEITMENVTLEMNVSGEILNSILQYNSKENNKASVAQPIQKLFYLDEQGCLTFTTGACINNFTLEKPIKLLMNSRFVKLFKLFKKDMVHLSLAHDTVAVGDNSELIQVKVRLETPNITLTAITPSDEKLFTKFPVAKIRSLASKERDNKLVLNKENFLQALKRLAFFDTADAISVTCSQDSVTLRAQENEEILKAENGSAGGEYSFLINLTNLITVLESCSDQFITMSYGDHTAIAIHRAGVVNILPESIKR